MGERRNASYSPKKDFLFISVTKVPRFAKFQLAIPTKDIDYADDIAVIFSTWAQGKTKLY